MKGAVQLEILRREGQHVKVLRPGVHPPEAFIQIVVVVEEGSAGALRQFRQDVILDKSLLAPEIRLHSLGVDTESGWLAGIAARNDDVEASCIERADDHVGTVRTVDDFRLIVYQIERRNEAWGDQD